jgi:hypothetical protein
MGPGAAQPLVVFCCSCLQACALRQAHTRQDDSSTGGQTATGSDTQSSRQGDSAPSNSGSKASSGRGLVCRQRQHTGKGLQQLPPASGSVSGAAAAVAAGPETAAAPAAVNSPPEANQQPILYQPYSHFFSGSSVYKPRRRAYISRVLCTDTEEVQSVHGSCSIQVSFMSHPAGWDVNEYVKQHPHHTAATGGSTGFRQ